MGEIEFLPLGNEPSGGLDVPEPRAGLLRRHLSTTIAAGLWTASGALCVLAPFRALFQENQQGFAEGIDGWGRYFLRGGFVDVEAPPAGYHGTRYGVALLACAVLFTALAVSVATFAWRQPRWAHTVRGARTIRVSMPAIGFAAFGITAGTGLGQLLEALAERDRFFAGVGSGDAGLPSGARPAFQIGGSVWLTFLAAACALAAVLASLAPPPEDPPRATVVAVVEPEPIATSPDEDDEFLIG